MYKNFFKKKLENVFTSYKLQASEQMGFVYNTTTKGDSKSCNCGGLGKWMKDRAAAKLQELLLYGQDTKDSRFKATKW